MRLQGQHGYAMVLLLIGLSIMAIMMTVAMPVYKQSAQREKEAELVFRGQQYVHAIGLFQRKAGPGVFPPSVDVLVEQRFLRKKYKDPITGADFQPLPAVQGTAAPGQVAGQRGAAPPANPGSAPGAVATTALAGGVGGVASKSTDASIRIYNGRTHYNEWEFRFLAQTQAPGAGGPAGTPQRGGPPNQPGPPGVGGRGLPPPGGRGTALPNPFGGRGRGAGGP